MKKVLYAKFDPKECVKTSQTCYKVTTRPTSYCLLPTRCQSCEGCAAISQKGVVA